MDNIGLAYIFGSFLERDDFQELDVAIHLRGMQSTYQSFMSASSVARSLEQAVLHRVDFDIRILNYAPAFF